MRLIDIDLERYGPFTGQHLVFRPEARLHVVYGANEAGKSCALAAITDLFFGIERQTRYDFLHEGKEMRLGATVIIADGTSLKFRRRKNRPILTDPTDRPLPDDALAPYLGSLSREVFCRAFGLNATALRESGEELRKSDGELGASLFAAASGLRGFQDLRAQVEREADGIFAPRAGRDRLSERYFQSG
jgi:chromosome segregation protein